MTLDCLIVGGGPAGLAAAIYAARFRLAVRVIDAEDSRAALIPCTRNHAGFPDGVAGRDLLDRMRRQAVKAGAIIDFGKVSKLAASAHAIKAETTRGAVSARAVLLATGVTNLSPNMDANLRRAAVTAGRLRYCPVCDGYEVADQAVAVIGTGARGTKEALFLRAYTLTVTLVSDGDKHVLAAHQRRDLLSAGVDIVDGPAREFQLDQFGLSFATGAGRRVFDAVYPAMGSNVHSGLAKQLGAKTTAEGCVRVDAHQRTTAPRLYAAGDVVIGLDQISHAMGEAGVAATTIRNDLAVERPLLR
jgi:thioredoxin reductase (NADPH)